MSSLGILSTQAAQARGQHSLVGWTEEGVAVGSVSHSLAYVTNANKIEHGVLKQNKGVHEKRGKEGRREIRRAKGRLVD